MFQEIVDEFEVLGFKFVGFGGMEDISQQIFRAERVKFFLIDLAFLK